MIILGQDVEFRVELDAAETAAQSSSLRVLADEMAGIINDREGLWTTDQVEVFHLTRAVVIFRKNKYGKHKMSRSYMASKERTFFWTFDDFTAPGVVGPRRPTMYFHDCFHVRQFLEDGQPPNDTEVLIDREQEAMVAQLEAATTLGCDEDFLKYLRDYAESRDKIRQRLSSGLGMTQTIRPHLTVF